MQADPLEKFYLQFQRFVENNPNVISAARAASQIPESAKAIVILSPYSLYHVFPREWVSKAYRKTIVERPERLLAASMGIAAAITMYPALFNLKSSHNRLGSLSSPHVLKVHGSTWPHTLTKLCTEADDKLANGKIEVPNNWNAGDIYLSSQTLLALKGSLGAIETGVDSIFKCPSPDHISNRAFVVIRPPGHHCHVSMPSGFCLLNNVHVAIEYAFDHYDVTHVAVLDFDLHHGDGTQDICWKRAGFKPDGEDAIDEETNNKYNDFNKRSARFPKVGYFSMHDINSFPTETDYATSDHIKNASTCIMNSHDLNIWNIHLSNWSTDEEFQKLYRSKYRTLFAKADEFFKTAKYEMEHQDNDDDDDSNHTNNDNENGASSNNSPTPPTPKKPFKGLVIISAGFDASEFEQTSMQRHKVNVPTEFYTTFTKDALKLSQMHCKGKVLSVMEGGYSDQAICSGVFAHLIGLQNQDWINEWGSQQVVKEISRGCKPNWKPYKTKKSNDVIRIWAEEVIRLGRSMVPEFDDVIFKSKEKLLKHKQEQRAALTNDGKFNESMVGATISQRVTRAYAKERDHHKHDATRHNMPLSVKQENVPFMQMNLSDEDEKEDDDYEYDEELNKTFNRTVEDITIDDISRHLETLELIQQDEGEEEDNRDKSKSSSSRRLQSSNGMYKIPSDKTTNNLRHNSRVLSSSQQGHQTQNYDDSDISMMSHVSTMKHSTRSGRKW